MGIGLLGPLRVDGGGSLEPRDRIALSVLAVRRGQVVSPEQFADALWGDTPPSSWAKQVQICVGRLRKVLGQAAIETSSGGYRLALDGDDVDSYQFEHLVERARVLTATGQVDRAAAVYARALGLWRGSPLDELDGWLPGRSEAARLEELRRTAEEDWLDSRLAAGEHREVAVEAEALVTAEPLRERRWATLALAQYRCGRQGDALRSLARARRTLATELGVDPGEDLVALEASMLRHDPSLNAAPEPPAVSDECPYKGLAPYDVRDTDTFFGRDDEVAACVERLRATPLLLVAGPSGSGKSSLVRAGLVPALWRRGRSAVVFAPGADPEAAMDATLADTDGSAVLVVDQFEELFALGHSHDVVYRVCHRLATYAAEQAPVVLVVRSDHVGGLSVDPRLSRLAERGLHLVSPLTGTALRESIEQPAALAGLRLEPGLVELLVRDCEGEPGGLPLLSHALAETWRRRDGSVLTVEGYRATGGIRGAVARSADRLYDSLTGKQRTVLRSVLLRLVTPSLEGDPVRCRVPSRSLLGDSDRERIVALLVRARLVTSEEDSFELAHEALARAWPRLQSWLDDDAAGQRALRHLTVAADGWESLGRPASELYRGARLDTALEWQEATAPHLTNLERAFLDASSAQAASDEHAATQRARRDARQNRQLRVLLVATGVILVAAIIVGLVAIRQRENATAERRIAAARELAAAANANVSIDAERSVLLAIAAIETTRAADGTVLPEAEEALHRAMTADRIELRVPNAGGALDWSPEDSVFVAAGGSSAGAVDIRDVRTGASVRTVRVSDGDVTGVAFSNDGAMFATTGTDGAASVWNSTTGERLGTMAGSADAGAQGPSFSRDGAFLAAAWPDEAGGVVRVLELSSGQVIREIDTVPGPVATSFDPTGLRLAIASGFAPVVVALDVASGEEVFTAATHTAPLVDVAWSPDGASVATASFDASARIFDATTGRQRFALLGHAAGLTAVDWSPDALRLVTGGADGTARVWALVEGDGREAAVLAAYDTRRALSSVAFSPDGNRVITGDTGAVSAIVWDVGVTAGSEVANLPAVGFHFGEADFANDGRSLVSTSGGGALAVWRATTWARDRTVGGGSDDPPRTSLPGVPMRSVGDVERVSVDPSGRLVALVRETGGGAVEVWDLDAGRSVFSVNVGSGWPWVSWSPDGERLAVAGGDDASVTVVDRSGREVARLELPEDKVSHVAFGADGNQLVATVESADDYEHNDGRVVLWDWRDNRIVQSITTEAGGAYPSPAGDLVAVLPHPRSGSQTVEIRDLRSGQVVTALAGHTGDVTDVAFTADGSRVATASSDGTIRLWDPRSGDEPFVLHGHFGAVSSVDFSPDGSHLASYGVEGIVRVWALHLDELLDIARSHLTRGLTRDECRQYLHVENCP